MANLKLHLVGTGKRVDELQLDDFEPKPSGQLLELNVIENGTLILIEELLGDAVYSTFFDSISLEKISTEERYKTYHNKQSVCQLTPSLRSISAIKVSLETGGETVEEKLLDGELVIYRSGRVRYPEEKLSILDRYFAQQEHIKNQKRIEGNLN